MEEKKAENLHVEIYNLQKNYLRKNPYTSHCLERKPLTLINRNIVSQLIDCIYPIFEIFDIKK